ncbi:Uncharacterised protein [Kluyvera cryocrescens]|uniref:Uncharacterized protein n=2 Tax=Kluyvera cryocrescens TaxID=580 RepID=A0A485BNC6_KLUCR|nr:Uncharacterised protein [Kluyvera cryocrescens]
MVAGFLVLGAIVVAFIPMKTVAKPMVNAGTAPESA